MIHLKKTIVLYAIIKDKKEIKSKATVEDACNKELSCIVGNVVVDNACSQVGYMEKKSSDNIDSCNENIGTENYQKYGNNGEIWDAAFINWVFDSSNISLSKKGIDDVFTVNSYVNWAVNSSRWYTSKSSLHNGDLVLTNDNNHISIAVNIKGTWYMISGNFNNKVDLLVIEQATGFINMKGISY